MTLEQAMKCASKIVKLFQSPPIDSEVLKLATRGLLAFDFGTADEQIENHKNTHVFFEWAELRSACEGASRIPDPAGRAAIPDQSHADILRRLDAQLRPVQSDIDVIIRSYRKQWHACGMRAEYRESIGRQCAMALCGLPLDGNPLELDMAGRWAATIFGDVEYFRDVLDDLRARHVSGRAPEVQSCPDWKQSIDGIRKHFESAWKSAKASAADERGKAFVRGTIFRHAVMALGDLRIEGRPLPANEVEEWARAFIGLEPGEPIPRPVQRFAAGIKIQEPPSSFEALSALVRNEQTVGALAAPAVRPDPVPSGSLIGTELLGSPYGHWSE